MPIIVGPSGPAPARIMIIGEAPGDNEERTGIPFVGESGQELDRMLAEAGIIRAQCFTTNVCKVRPPNNDLIGNFIIETKQKGRASGWPFRNGVWYNKYVTDGMAQLRKEIDLVKPNLIIACGNLALWALCSKVAPMKKLAGIVKWQGSILASDFLRDDGDPYKVIPVMHPAGVMRSWSDRWPTVEYLRRAAEEAKTTTIVLPKWNRIVRPSYGFTNAWLNQLEAKVKKEPTDIVVDLETRARHIACIGLAWRKDEAICIPFMCLEDHTGYWSEEHEIKIVLQLRRILTHPNARVIGQNFLYDCQYIARWWHFIPNVSFDTMIQWHTCFPGTPKGIHRIASLLCPKYVYWKDEGKEWDITIPEEEYWNYNCLDCLYEFEVKEVIKSIIPKMGLEGPAAFQQSLFHPVLRMILRGVNPNFRLKATLSNELEIAMQEKVDWLEAICGHPINPRSTQQLQNLFYHDMKIKPVIKRSTKKWTTDVDALAVIAQREPIAAPIVERIGTYRTLGVLKSNLLSASLSDDGRLRCSYDPTGTETFRFNSREDAFGDGTNLQNITKGDDGEEPEDRKGIPNLRRLIQPDPGYIIIDADLDRADLQIVVWESNDVELKQMLREGVDLHAENAKLLGCSRQRAKVFVHGTNYGGKAGTMATACGITRYRAEKMQKLWFAAHPGIAAWHTHVQASLDNGRAIRNPFGFQRIYFDRVERLLPQALGWIPQSTVGIIINHGLVAIDKNLPDVELLLQTHDSLTMQIPNYEMDITLKKINEQLLIPVPYDDPLTISLSFAISDKSWGEVKDYDWQSAA